MTKLVIILNPYSKLLNYLPTRKIRGDADIILFHNFHHANIAYNLMVHSIKAKSATIIAGTIAPVVFNSRDDTAEAKFHSIVFSALYSEQLLKEEKE